jgi:hypothetical protein
MIAYNSIMVAIMGIGKAFVNNAIKEKAISASSIK